MRSEKDEVIRQLSDEKEEQRRTMQARIDLLEVQVQQHEQAAIEMKNKVAELTSELNRKKDVESQLETQRERNAELED